MWKKRRPHLLKIKLYSTRVYPVHANTKGILIECCDDQKFIGEMYGQESQTQQIKRKNNTFTERCVREYELQLSPGGGGGAPHMKGVGILVGNFKLNPRDRSGRGPSVFCPLKETTRIYISNTYFYIFSRATLNETFTAKFDGVLPRTP